MDQPVGFIEEGKEHMICELKKSLYGLKQGSRKWYPKFNDTIMSFGFKEYIIDQCINKCHISVIFHIKLQTLMNIYW